MSSIDTFDSAIRNLETAKALDRSANGTAIDNRYEEPWNQFDNHLHQIFSFIFVTERALDDETIVMQMLERVTAQSPHLWPNVIFALDQYLCTYRCDEGVCTNPNHARGVAIQRACNDDEILMRFYLLLGRALDAIRVSSFPYWEYLYQAKTWPADVHYACTDNPPPYLSSIVR